LPFAREAVRLGCLISKAKIERCGERSLPVLSMTMHDGITRQSDRFKKVVASRNTSSYKVVQPGQLVVGFPIDEGVIYVQDFDEPGIMSPAYNVWNIDSAKVLPGYLNAALHSPQSMSYYRAKLRGTTARRRTITDANLLALRIPLPDINEQHQIVESLNSIQNDIDSCDSQLDIISCLIKSRFVEMFGDGDFPRFRLDKVADVQGGLTKNRRRETLPMRLPYLRVANVGPTGGVDTNEMLSIGLTDVEARKTLLKTGDLLFVEGNGSKNQIGRVAIWDGSIDPCVHQNHLIRARLYKDVLPIFALTYFSSPDGRRQITNKAASTSGLFTLSTGKIKSLVLPVPPLSLQHEFSDFAAQVDKLRVVAEKEKQTLQTLYDSLAQEYFAI
jgi:type I restriction enzyme S subunit